MGNGRKNGDVGGKRRKGQKYDTWKWEKAVRIGTRRWGGKMLVVKKQRQSFLQD